ncbi:disease resistance-responsive (dirigent-like protein) family protein [Artemisia annua]|uniref:Disease resistance-responsive (Dirigent-like protein) family protein n=1 Tax=Artemisia annua TaxID=35608 RepID=A0A2U1QBY2_ARTAN|nr:disease resistance-responsive (dirigent-like protein) family protein [Artemisia annua]
MSKQSLLSVFTILLHINVLTVIAVVNPAPSASGDHVFELYMHDILGGSNPTARRVTGLLGNIYSGQVKYHSLDIYAAGVSGYLNTPNWNNQKQNTPYVYNISDDDVDLHDTDNEGVCLTHNSRRLSETKSESGKKICKFDYSDDESDDEVVCFTRSSRRLSKPKFARENNICKSDNFEDELDAKYRETSIEVLYFL